MRRFLRLACLTGLLMVSLNAYAQEKNHHNTKQLPPEVMEGLKAKFPLAQIDKWTREKEREAVVYDIEFTQAGQKFEADIREDGTIDNWEKAIAAKDLPAAVRETVGKKYPKSRIVEVMEITVVKDGKDELDGYEIVLKTGGKKSVEVTMAPDGRILEESGNEE